MSTWFSVLGLLVVCEKCGGRLVGKWGKDKFYWQCVDCGKRVT
jgi:ssDNA-binding Zn-finger/Zn-ribbon topoisomerase 1